MAKEKKNNRNLRIAVLVILAIVVAFYFFYTSTNVLQSPVGKAFEVTGDPIEREFSCISSCVYDCGGGNTQTENIEWLACAITKQGAENTVYAACKDAEPTGCTLSIWGYGGVTCTPTGKTCKKTLSQVNQEVARLS